MKILVALLCLIALQGCGKTLTLDEQLDRVSKSPGKPVDPISIDLGPVDRYNHCKAKPRRTLTAQEQCELSMLRSRCSVADDCMVSCLSSPDSIRITHGCSDVCPIDVSPLDLSKCEISG